MSMGAGRCVYRSRTQSFAIVMVLVAHDVLVGAGVARNIDRTGLAIFGIGLILLVTAVLWRAAVTAIITSPDGIRVRNVLSNADFKWTEIERFEIDAAKGWFPQICRVYTEDGRVKRAFGIQETNIALSRPIEKRPAARIVKELNALLAGQRGSCI
jgi:hypothetical protein